MGVELAQYSNINLYTLTKLDAMTLTFSLITVDDNLTCKLSSTLEEQNMKSNLALLECNSANYAMDDAKKIIKTVMQYASPYLKEHF